MAEKILKIETVDDFSISEIDNTWRRFAGYWIITDQQTIRLGISNAQDCCESWGYFTSEDDVNQFVGAELLGLEVVDSALKPHQLADIGLYEDSCMFVNINTSKGLLQFVAYNEHNGYYSHEAAVISKQLNDTTYL